MASAFTSDTHRRVAANLAQPRSPADLARLLRTLDPHVDDSAYSPEGVGEYLADLEADGLVKRVPAVEDPRTLISTIEEDPDLVTLPKAKAKNLLERAENPRSFPFPEREDQWAMTTAALDALTAPAENEPPPLTGESLRRAEEQNEELAKRDAALAREEAARTVEGLRRRADELTKEYDL